MAIQRTLVQKEEFATYFVDRKEAERIRVLLDGSKQFVDFVYKIEDAERREDYQPKGVYIHRYSEHGWDGIIKLR